MPQQYPIVKIPYSCSSDNVYEMMKAFIRDYIRELGKIAGTGRGTPMPWMVVALEMKYVWASPRDNNILSDAQIANIVNKNPESVRTTMRDYSSNGIKIIAEDVPHLGIAVSDAMKDIFKAIKEELKPVVCFPLLKEKLSVGDDRTLSFFLDGLNYDISAQDKQICINEDDFGKGAKSFATKNLPKLINYLKQDPVPHRFLAEVQPFMKDQRWDDTQCRLMKCYMLADSDEFEWETDDLGTERVALKWPAIDSVDGRRVRILYEFFLANGANKTMKKKDLNDEYNRRAAIYGLEQIDPIRSLTSPLAENIGNGCYRYCVNSNAIVPVDISAELKKHIAKNSGKIKFDDAVVFVHGFNSTYSNSAVERFLRDAGCWQHKENGATYYLMEPFYTKPVTANPTPTKRSRPISDTTKQRCDFALNLIRNAPDQTITKKEANEAMKPLFPAGAAITNIYKIFDLLIKDGLIVKEGSGKGGSYRLV